VTWLINTLKWIWDRTIVSTFLAGLFVLLPLAVTLAVMSWVASLIQEWLGPESTVGWALRQIGLRFVTEPTVALILGWLIVIAGLWGLGVLVKTVGRRRIETAYNNILDHIPVFRSFYRPISQLVGLLKQDQEEQLKGMRVVYCEFGEPGTAGMLALMVDNTTYRFRDQDCRLVYVPTSPLPMTGCLMTVAADKIEPIDMSPEHLLRIYFSVGVLARETVPPAYLRAPAQADHPEAQA